MARVAVFGAGAMGTAVAMHATRRGLPTALWANPYDLETLDFMREEGRHPALPEHLPGGLELLGPDDLDRAAAGCEIAVMAASSSGARSLAEMVRSAVAGARFAVSIAKGLETDTGKRPSGVYEEVLAGPTVIATAGPCLAAELAQGFPSAMVWAAGGVEDARKAGEPLADDHLQIEFTDDVAGAEYCAVAKNVAAIGMGFLDGLGKILSYDYKNAKAALLTKAVGEMAVLVRALGGRQETAWGLAGLGDVLVTSLGGRNRLYGELVGAGGHPDEVLRDLSARGMTVEGVESSRQIARLAAEANLELPYHSSIHRVLFEGADPRAILEVLL